MSVLNVVRALIVACLLAIGSVAGWVAKSFTVEVEPVVETERPMKKKADGSVVAAVKLHAKPVTPRPSISPGSRIERTIEFTVQPVATDAVEQAQGKGPCQPLDLRVDLLKNLDGTTDAQIFTQDGTILGASNFPQVTIFAARQRPWLVAATFSPDRHSFDGVVVGRDVFKRLFVGGSAQLDEEGRITTRALIGGNF